MKDLIKICVLIKLVSAHITKEKRLIITSNLIHKQHIFYSRHITMDLKLICDLELINVCIKYNIDQL